MTIKFVMVSPVSQTMAVPCDNGATVLQRIFEFPF